MRHADLNICPSLCRTMVSSASFNYFMECSFGNLQSSNAVRSQSHLIKGPIRNTHTQYAIRSVPQRGPTHNTQYAIRNTQPCSQQASGVAPHTQYAIRDTQPCSQQAFERRTPYAIRNTQYAIRNVPHRALLSIRKTLPQYAVAQYAAYTVCDTSL